jgi:hypothetical protein
MRLSLLVLLIIIIATTTFAQQHNGVLGVGYGMPSVIKFAISRANLNPGAGYVILHPKGYGPFHAKGEYIFNNIVGIGYSGMYNFIDITYHDKFKDTFVLKIRDYTHQVRLNIYAINNKHHQLAIGAGLGIVQFNNTACRTTRLHDTFNRCYTLIEKFEPRTFEATLAYRYFVNKHLGLYAELGAGRAINQFASLGFVDSWGQLGISYKLLGYKKQRLPWHIKQPQVNDAIQPAGNTQK